MTATVTLEELSEKVYHLEEQVRDLQQSLREQGVLQVEKDTADVMVRNQRLIQLLDAWAEGDEQDQRETWDYLQTALDKGDYDDGIARG